MNEEALKPVEMNLSQFEIQLDASSAKNIGPQEDSADGKTKPILKKKRPISAYA